MADKFEKVLAGFFSEANTVCGSEGLYQSIFYHHARGEFRQNQIRREESSEGGKIDFILEDTDRTIAVELKAGANGHRNSLANMKEVESKGKGLQHDLAKLRSLERRQSKRVESWLVCLDLAALGVAFSKSDLEKYSRLSNVQETRFAYLSQQNDEYQTWIAGQRKVRKLNAPHHAKQIDRQLLESKALWSDFFAEVALDRGGPECSHVGLFYHVLRRTGLHHKQAASEVFFNCTRYGTRQYYIPDFAIFDERFSGHFQLYGNNLRTIENDQYKLPALLSVLEFKGGAAFRAKSISKRKEEIVSDVEKLVQQIKPRIETSLSFQERDKNVANPKFTMVVTDDDPRLQPCIESLRVKNVGIADIRWAGDS